MSKEETIRVFVGTDRTQSLAFSVLKHSILANTKSRVEITPMLDLSIPVPKHPQNWQRTGFSFSRFCIPKLCNYTGKAIYLDADMLVFSDIKSLWDRPFLNKKIIIQEIVKHESISTKKEGAPTTRKKQSSVMLLNCSELDWDINHIVGQLDNGDYHYDDLLFELCILAEQDILYGIPFEWNSLEYWDNTTHLLHYTDVYTQPWVHAGHTYGYLWLTTLRDMIKRKLLSSADISKEIKLGYCRPSLLQDIRFRHLIPMLFKKRWDDYQSLQDKSKGFIKHKDIYRLKKKRKKAIESALSVNLQ